MFEYIQIKLTYALLYLLQTSFVKYIVHMYKYMNNTLYIGDYSADDFSKSWTIICMKKCPNGSYYYLIDPTTPLNKITTDVVYTLQDSAGHVRYFPVFTEEISNIIECTHEDDITLYNVLRWRINNQISDYSFESNSIYNNLFDEDDQFFIPYMEDNNYMVLLEHMYSIGAIY